MDSAKLNRFEAIARTALGENTTPGTSAIIAAVVAALSAAQTTDEVVKILVFLANFTGQAVRFGVAATHVRGHCQQCTESFLKDFAVGLGYAIPTIEHDEDDDDDAEDDDVSIVSVH